MTDKKQWWFCMRHKTVEPDEGCAGTERLGPYPSAEEAARAYEKAAERTEAWDHDPRWSDDDD
jgi:hypothetical protein